MSATIVLNQSNIVNVDNNTLVYRFPNSIAFPHHQIAVQSITMYYAWENINDTTLGNNKFSYVWTTGATSTEYLCIVPDGLYEISDLNSFLQFTMIANGQYLIDNNGDFVYYAEMLVNASIYAVQVNTFPVPTDTDWTFVSGNLWTGNPGSPYAGWTTPVNWIGFPTVTFNPSMRFYENFNLIVGFNPYPTAETGLFPGVGANQSFTSAFAPQVQPNPSVYFSISNINNIYAVPSSIIYALSPNVAFGEQINDRPPQYTYNKLLPGTYNEIRLQILGTNRAPIKILDPNMTILLAIRDTKDMGLGDLMNVAQGGKG